MKIKSALIVLVIALALIICSVFGSATLVNAINQNGYAVPAVNNPLNYINSEKTSPLSLIEVDNTDEVYKNVEGYYLGRNHSLVNLTYPLYINGGGALSFLDDEKWLVSDELILLQSFDGMYLSDGITYGEDHTRADEDNFILVSLDNGLYMNARKGAFINVNGEHVIPINSIIKFSEDGIAWMYYSDGTLNYDSESSVFNARIRIGEDEYDYAAFLKALELVAEGIKLADDGLNPDDVLERAFNTIRTVINPKAGGFVDHYSTESDNSDVERSEEENVGEKDPDEEEQSEEGDKTEETSKNENGKTKEDNEQGKGGDDKSSSQKNNDKSSGKSSQSGGKSSKKGGGSKSSKPAKQTGGKATGSGDDDDEDYEDEIDPGTDPYEPDPIDDDDDDEDHTLPVVTLNDITPWSYSIFGKLKIKDPGYNVIKGVKVCVYNDIVHYDAYDPVTDVTTGTAFDMDGNPYEITVYNSTNAKGERVTACTDLEQRKTYSNSKDVILPSVEPDSTVYVQFNYKYYSYTDRQVEENGVMVTRTFVSRVTYYSPIYEVHTLPIDGNVLDITYDWDEMFCYSANSFCFDNIKLSNAPVTTSGGAVATPSSIESYINNSLQFISKIEIDLTPESFSGRPVKATIKSSTIDSFIVGDTDTYASGEILQNNAKYSYSVKFIDKFGDEISSRPADGSKIKGVVYTSKKIPAVKIETPYSAPGRIDLHISINDEDNVLLSRGTERMPLIMKVFDSSNNQCVLGGTVSNGAVFVPNDNYTVNLTGDDNYLSLTSLDYNKSYTVRIYANYNNMTEAYGSLEELEGYEILTDTYGEIANEKIRTSAFIMGSVIVNASVDNITSNSAVLNLKVNNQSKLSTDERISAVLDVLRISLETEKVSQSVQINLSKENLDKSVNAFNGGYHSNIGGVLIQDVSSSAPGIRLKGSEELFSGRTVWECLFPETDANGNAHESAMIEITLPSNSLNSASRYTIGCDSLSIRSAVEAGQYVLKEYSISTRVTSSYFYTYKREPSGNVSELVTYGNNIELIDFYISDPDEVIDGTVTAKVYADGILIAAKEIPDYTVPHTLEFTGLGISPYYQVEVVASKYVLGVNDTKGQANVTVWRSAIITAGDSLTGDLSLDSLDYLGSALGTPWINLSKEELAADKNWTASSTTGTYTANLIPEGTDFIRVNLLDVNKYSNSGKVTAKFTLKNGSTVSYDSVIYLNVAPVFLVPADAAKVSFTLPVEYKNGLVIDRFTSPDERKTVEEIQSKSWTKQYRFDYNNGSLVSDNNYKVLHLVEVTPGEHYYVGGNSNSNSCWIACYSADKSYIYSFGFGSSGRTTVNNMINKDFVVGQNVHYISIITSIDADKINLYRMATSENVTDYVANYSVNIQDLGGYTVKKRADNSVYSESTLNIYKSLDKVNLKYELVTSKAVVLEKTSVILPGDTEPSEIWTNPKVNWTEDGLSANCAWKIELVSDYMNRSVVLDTLEFSTDESCFLIKNARDLINMRNNPYANFIVVNDFAITNDDMKVNSEWFMKFDFYGTIDFQGHVVTKKTSEASGMFYRNYGTIKNAVIELTSGYTNNSPFVEQNYGVIENCIIKTDGVVYQSDTAHCVFVDENKGLIDRFIFVLGDNWVLTYPERGGDRTYYVLIKNNGLGGTIQNGYITSMNQGGLCASVGKDFEGFAGFSLFNSNAKGATFKNVFSTINIYASDKLSAKYKDTPTKGEYMFFSSNAGNIEDIYWSGESYLEVDGNIVNRMALTDTDIICGGLGKTSKNVTHVTSAGRNKAKVNSYITVVNYSLLRKSSWQESILGDAFDVEAYLSVGLYPRLILPEAVDHHQPYIELPDIAGSNYPIPVDDAWDTTSDHNDESGGITLLFKVPDNTAISAVEIDGLVDNTTGLPKISVVGTDRLADGYLRVKLKVKASAYRSSYNLTKIYYTYNNISSTNAPQNFWTGNIEFWKVISDADQWKTIKNHLDWNYHIISEMGNPVRIDMSSLTADEMRIDGEFVGRIDGASYDVNGKVTGMSSLVDINLSNQEKAYVFKGFGNESTSLNYNAALSNLIIEGMNITVKSGSTCAGAGFINRSCNAVISNVHIMNSSIRGRGKVGSLISVISTLSSSQTVAMPMEINDCSVNNVSIRDNNTTDKLYVGGMIGSVDVTGNSTSTYQVEVNNSYVYNLAVDIENSANLQGAGAIAGRYCGTIENCYATGRIYAVGNYVGGLVGSSFSEPTSSVNINNCWSSVTVKATGIYTGGIAGGSATINNTLVAGNVIASSDMYAHRIKGLSSVATLNTKNYAYSAQMVIKTTGVPLGPDDKDDAYGMATVADLDTRSFWMNDMSYNSKDWDFSVIDSNAYPKVLSSDGSMEQVYGQDNMIMLPNLATDLSMEIVSSFVADEITDHYNVGYYVANVVIENSGYNAEQLKNMLDDNFKIDFYGISPVDSFYYFTENPSDIAANRNRVHIEIVSKVPPVRAFDAYILTATFTDSNKSVSEAISFGTPIYWNIDSKDRWDSIVSDHGKAGENFNITAKVDFHNQDTEYDLLRLGRLKGDGKGSGFYNLSYDGKTSSDSANNGNPWISVIGTELTGITFENVDCNLSDTAYARSDSGLISSANNIHDCTFTDVSMEVNRNSAKHAGLVSYVFTNIDNVTISGLSMKSKESDGAGVYGQGALAAEVYDYISNIRADHVDVNIAYGRQTGGIIGVITDMNKVVATSRNITLTNSTVCAFGDVGGVAYSLRGFDNGLVDNCTIIAKRYSSYGDDTWAGGFEAILTNSGGSYTTKNVTVKNSLIETIANSADKGHTGALFGRTYSAHSLSNALSLNNMVLGNSYIGGITGYSESPVSNSQVVNAYVGIQNPAYSYGGSTGGFGGAFGYASGSNNGLTVRNVKVYGPNRVGGLYGYGSSSISNSFISEDVVITGCAYVGGIAGNTSGTFSNIACGADVNGTTNVGGLIGYISTSSQGTKYLTNCYYVGDITEIDKPEEFKFNIPAKTEYVDLTAGEYFGGVVGRFIIRSTSSPRKNFTLVTYRYTNDNFSKVVFAGNITTKSTAYGKKVSFFTNCLYPYELYANKDNLYNSSETLEYEYMSSGDYTDSFYLFEGSKKNGKTAASLFSSETQPVHHEMDDQLAWANDKHENLPSGTTLATENNLANPSWWISTLGYNEKYWDISNMYDWSSYTTGEVDYYTGLVPDAYIPFGRVSVKSSSWFYTGYNTAIYDQFSVSTRLTWTGTRSGSASKSYLFANGVQAQLYVTGGKYYIANTSTGLNAVVNEPTRVTYSSEISGSKDIQTLVVGDKSVTLNYDSMNLPNKGIYLFDIVGDDSSSTYSLVDIGYTEISLNGQLVETLIPCRRKLDQRAGFYVVKYNGGEVTSKYFAPVIIRSIAGSGSTLNGSNKFMPYPSNTNTELKYAAFSSYDENGNPNCTALSGIMRPAGTMMSVAAPAPKKSGMLSTMLSSYVKTLSASPELNEEDDLSETSVPDDEPDEEGSDNDELFGKESDAEINSKLAKSMLLASLDPAEKMADENKPVIELEPESKEYNQVVREGFREIMKEHPSEEKLLDLGIVELKSEEPETEEAEPYYLIAGVGLVDSDGEIKQPAEERNIISIPAEDMGEFYTASADVKDKSFLDNPVVKDRLDENSNRYRNVSDTETKGYTLLTITSITALIVLAIVFAIIISRKRHNGN